MQETAGKAIDTDEELARKIQAGDKELFGELVGRYQKKLENYGKKLLFTPQDLEDTVQEIFIKAYQNLQSFDPKRRFSPWIYRIAHNEFVNKGKKFSRQLVDYFDFDTFFPHPKTTTTPATELEKQELKTKAEQLLLGLDSKYREPLYLHIYEDLDYKEIADVLKLPISTVGVRIMRARKMLQAKIQD